MRSDFGGIFKIVQIYERCELQTKCKLDNAELFLKLYLGKYCSQRNASVERMAHVDVDFSLENLTKHKYRTRVLFPI